MYLARMTNNIFIYEDKQTNKQKRTYIENAVIY